MHPIWEKGGSSYRMVGPKTDRYYICESVEQILLQSYGYIVCDQSGLSTIQSWSKVASSGQSLRNNAAGVSLTRPSQVYAKSNWAYCSRLNEAHNMVTSGSGQVELQSKVREDRYRLLYIFILRFNDLILLSLRTKYFHNTSPHTLEMGERVKIIKL